MLLREHAKKPITKAELRAAVLRDRPDRSGKIMKVVVASANKKLAHIAGLELVLDNSNDAEEDGARSTPAVHMSTPTEGHARSLLGLVEQAQMRARRARPQRRRRAARVARRRPSTCW